jgi:U11/U12 small nuclear ribonucleoprotein SNRNP35
MRLVRDIVTGFSKRYAFIEYKDMRTVKKVYEEANNAIIDGKKILVDYECERTMSGWKPRRLGGGFGGKKESGQLRFGCRDRPWKRPITSNVSVDSNRDESYSSKSLQFYGKRNKDHQKYNVRRVETNSTEKEYRYHNHHRYDNKRKKK